MTRIRKVLEELNKITQITTANDLKSISHTANINIVFGPNKVPLYKSGHGTFNGSMVGIFKIGKNSKFTDLTGKNKDIELYKNMDLYIDINTGELVGLEIGQTVSIDEMISLRKQNLDKLIEDFERIYEKKLFSIEWEKERKNVLTEFKNFRSINVNYGTGGSKAIRAEFDSKYIDSLELGTFKFDIVLEFTSPTTIKFKLPTISYPKKPENIAIGEKIRLDILELIKKFFKVTVSEDWKGIKVYGEVTNLSKDIKSFNSLLKDISKYLEKLEE